LSLKIYPTLNVLLHTISMGLDDHLAFLNVHCHLACVHVINSSPDVIYMQIDFLQAEYGLSV